MTAATAPARARARARRSTGDGPPSSSGPSTAASTALAGLLDAVEPARRRASRRRAASRPFAALGCFWPMNRPTPRRVRMPTSRPSSTTGRPSSARRGDALEAVLQRSPGARNVSFGGLTITSATRVVAQSRAADPADLGDAEQRRRSSSPSTTGTAVTGDSPSSSCAANVSTVRLRRDRRGRPPSRRDRCGRRRGRRAGPDRARSSPRGSRNQPVSAIIAPGRPPSASRNAIPTPTITTSPVSRPLRGRGAPARPLRAGPAPRESRTIRPPSSGYAGTRLTSAEDAGSGRRGRPARPRRRRTPPPTPLAPSRQADQHRRRWRGWRAGREAAIAASSPGSVDDGSSGVAPPKNETAIARDLDAPPARDDARGRGRGRRSSAKNPSATIAAEDPRDAAPRAPGRPSVSWPTAITATSARTIDPAELDADLDPEDARDRDAHQVPARCAVSDGARATTRRRRRAGRRATTVRIAATSATTPTAIGVSDQNCSGKSWTRRPSRGSKV